MTFIIGVALHIKHLLGLFTFYIGLSLLLKFRRNKETAASFIVFFFILLIITFITPERVQRDGVVVVTEAGKVLVVLSLLILCSGIILIYKFRRNILKEIPFIGSIKIGVILYFTVDIINTIYILFHSSYSVNYLGNNIIILKVLLLPLIFLFICYRSLELFRDNKSRELPDIYNLTSREKEVLNLILSGHSNLEIENKLFIAKSTLKTHINKIFSKTMVSNRLELIFKFNS